MPRGASRSLPARQLALLLELGLLDLAPGEALIKNVKGGAGDQAPVHSLFQTVSSHGHLCEAIFAQQSTVGLPLTPRRPRHRIQRNERCRVRAIIFPCWVSGIGRKVSRTPPVTFTH